MELDLINESYKEARKIFAEKRNDSRDRIRVFKSALYSLEKILCADEINPRKSEIQGDTSAYDIIAVHMQVVEDLLFANSRHFEVYWIKLFARIKTRWDKEMLRGTWNEYVEKRKDYKDDINNLRSFLKYIKYFAEYFPRKIKFFLLIFFLILPIYLILIEKIVFRYKLLIIH